MANNIYYKYYKAEENACKLLNSKEINHIWKRDFKKDYTAHEDWDLINSEGVRIEVKSTIKPKSFSYNRVKFNTKNQYKNIVFKVLIDKKGSILMYKFVKNGKSWLDITEKIINSKSKFPAIQLNSCQRS